ncbi:MAG: S41 family peptidase [Clostridiales bacterium]|nr:S41 family peptidase [Clostridiales bacterium]
MLKKKSFWAGAAFGAAALIFFNALWGYAGSYVNIPALNRQLSAGAKMKEIYKVLDKYYVGTYDKERAAEGMYRGLVASVGDQYTTYMDAEAFASFMESVRGSYEGIGVSAYVSDNGEIIISAPFEGSPAAEAGVLPGDKIIKVNGSRVDGASFEKAVELLRGRPGTRVTMTVYRESEKRVLDFEITRGNIEASTVSSRLLDDGLGYLRLTSFDQVSYNQFKAAYDGLSAQGMTGLILDLRNNPGGSLKVACDIADLLVDADYIVYTEDKNGKRDYTYGKPDKIDVPLVVLVNGDSASAAEVLSGAIKDTKTGVLVGTQTYGKGVVQNLYFLPDRSGVKVTIAKYYTPSGVCIDGEGITPDYLVALDKEKSARISSLKDGEDAQLAEAVAIAERKVASGEW